MHSRSCAEAARARTPPPLLAWRTPPPLLPGQVTPPPLLPGQVTPFERGGAHAARTRPRLYGRPAYCKLADEVGMGAGFEA